MLNSRGRTGATHRTTTESLVPIIHAMGKTLVQRDARSREVQVGR
jgi:hypothetical protein